MTIDEQVKAVEREIGMRERVYPAWVRGGKMTQAKADHELAAMRAVLETLLRLAANQRRIENEALRHDIGKAIANHAADLSKEKNDEAIDYYCHHKLLRSKCGICSTHKDDSAIRRQAQAILDTLLLLAKEYDPAPEGQTLHPAEAIVDFLHGEDVAELLKVLARRMPEAAQSATQRSTTIKFCPACDREWHDVAPDSTSAKRYEWLRTHSWLDVSLIKSVLNFGPGYQQTKPEALDAAIDAALSSTASKEGG